MLGGNGICELPSWKNLTLDDTVIDIEPGKTFVHIDHDQLTGEQLIKVDCDIPFDYHFPSMYKFQLWDQIKNGPLKFTEEYVLIKCGNENNFLTREPIKDNKNHMKFPIPQNSVLKDQAPLVDDVVLLLLDAVSREHFNEEFPKTIAFFKDLDSHTNGTHETFSFNRYNVLGVNSPPNKAFIYSGQSKDYLYSEKKNAQGTWLWELFERQGFVTMHSDGECGGWWEFGYRGYADGAITYFYQKARDKMPGHHQFPHVSMCDTAQLFKDQEFGRTCKLRQGLDSQYDSLTIDGMIVASPFCMGQKAVYQAQFDYLKQFLQTYNGSNENGEGYKRFATVTLMDTHSPDTKLVSLDDSMVELFTELLRGKEGKQPFLKPNSVIVILSDHGMHYGSEVSTYEGSIHHHQPPLHIILPKSLADSHRPGFLVNQNKLTSHLDLHMTLLYLAFGKSKNNTNLIDISKALKEPSNFFEGRHNTKTTAQTYGDILLNPIEPTRTCNSIHIPSEFCPCIKYTMLNNTSVDDLRIINKILELATEYMNRKIESIGVGQVCQKFYFNSNHPNTSAPAEFKYGDLAYISGYYLPPSKKDSQIYSVVANVKSYPIAKLKFTGSHNSIINEQYQDIVVTQISSYKNEWEGICRKRIEQEKITAGEKMDFSQLNDAERAHIQKILEQKQLRELMKFYTGLVERCFNDCINDFTSKAISSKEETCVLRCAEKFIKYNERVGQRFGELNQQLMQQQAAQAQQGTTPFPGSSTASSPSERL
ncbi:hypothetical protein G9A89_020089 [Geosiphon pyriformis]|nr:hypothetical protein G9A89_020089 [Geosiphon pyriformis]